MLIPIVANNIGSCVVFVQKGKMNLALRNVGRHLCHPCTFFTDEPQYFVGECFGHIRIPFFALVRVFCDQTFLQNWTI